MLLTKILVVPLVLVLLSIGAVLSIFDPNHQEKNKSYRRDPHIARALERHHQLSRYTSESVGASASEYHPRLSPAYNQQNENIEQQERHASYNRDFANNIDDYYEGCPSGFTGQLPYPYDCRRFVNCWKGRAYIQTCGPGTVFNSETLECDSPAKVVCHGLNKKNPEAQGNRLGRIHTDDVSCPPGYTGLLVHPHDCSKFLNCASGTMYIQNCAPETMFNPTMKVCDFAHKVDCSGRGHGIHGSTSSTPPLMAAETGHRGGKTFVGITRDNQVINQEVPHRKGWPHHRHHHHHHQHHHQPPVNSYGSGSFVHHQHNCTDTTHNHHQSASPTSSNTPLVYRDRWSSMNRTRPPATADRPTPNRYWSKTSSWTPIPDTTTTPSPPPSAPRPSWQSHGSTWTTTTVRPSRNYPSYIFPTDHIDTTTTTTTTPSTNIYYAQPVYDDQSDEDVFSHVQGADVSEITIPFNRLNASRAVHDTISVPNINLMPPHLPSPSSDDGQSIIPEQLPDFSAPQPSYVSSTPPSFSHTSSRGHNPLPSSVDDHSSMDVIHIPSMHLLPPHKSPPPTDNRLPLSPASRPDPNDRTTVYMSPSHGGGHPTIDAINITPQWSPSPYPDEGQSRIPIFPIPDSQPEFNTTTIYITSPRPIYDESNLYGGLLPPLPSAPEPPSDEQFAVLSPPSTPTTPLRPFYGQITTTTPPSPGVKTNVHVFQIYPPPASVQNATTKLHPNPFYSPPYAGVAHSRNTTWSSYTPIKTKSSVDPTPPSSPPPKDNFEPEIIFSRDGGLSLSPRTPQRHGDLPSNYNDLYYKQTTPPSVYYAPPETDPDDEVGQLPISEAIRLLLRPYFNRSGTVSEEVAAKAESHIMNLARPKEPMTTTTTSTTTSTTTTPASFVSHELDKEVETIIAGEQNSLTGHFDHPIHTHVHSSSSKYHHHQPMHHNRDFHRSHPHLSNPFETTASENKDESLPEVTTKQTSWNGAVDPTYSTSTVGDPAVDDVCQFDCGNGKCIKTFEVCDGINNCGNRKDELNCDHLGYEIRLSMEDHGRVEVKILGHWGYVCDDKFGILDANVVCRELGFPLGASEVLGNSYYPPIEDDVSFVMDEIDCTGNETSLKDCTFMGWGVSDCGPEEVVGVRCKSSEMTCPTGDYWLCSTSKECIPPAFLCDNIPDCADQSDESSAVCNSTVEYRLRGGRTRQEGRLEVFYRKVWGTVCDDDFGQREAQVACNSLGFFGPAKVVKNAFGPGSGLIWLDQVSCLGNETSLDKCNHWTWGQHNCNHTEDVSLKCSAGPRPRPTIKSLSTPADDYDVQTMSLDDIGVDLYPVERSSKYKENRKICGHFNVNLTEEEPLELERVVKGNVAKRGHHPWQATIRTKGRGGISSHWCGAVLISRKHLLTAAHCLVGYPKGAYFIRLGDHYANIAESSEVDSYIENWYIHEKFREGTHMNNDIALIVMKIPVRFNDYIQPICLPPEGAKYEEGRECTISGWGSIQSGVSTPSNKLQAAMVPIISDDICKVPHIYGKSITDGMFCAGFLEEGVDACEGDSGGPFVCSDSGEETLYGIISWGQHCGHANKPGVYVRIEKYLDWIYEKIRFSLQQKN